jgi:ribosomal protein S6--L-glutamate ligase
MARRRVVVLVSGLGWHVDDLLRAAPLVGCELIPVPFPGISAGLGAGPATLRTAEADLRTADGVLVRLMPAGTLEQVVFRMDALHRLDDERRRVVNPPRAIEAAVDKFLALSRLERAGLAVPETWVGESPTEAMAAFDRLGGDVVVKPLFGSEGRGLVRVSDPEMARRVFFTLAQIGAVLYVQKFIRHDGTDLRVFVIEGRALGAIRRHAAAGDWRTNVAVGGRAQSVKLELATAELAIRAAAAVGAIVAGVDLIFDPDRGGLVVPEVNAVPGWRAFAPATGIDVAAEILRLFPGGD